VKQQERYHITFAFGSFVYLFVVIGAATGFTFGILLAIWSIFSFGFSLALAGSVIANIFVSSFMTSLYFAVSAAIGFLPYRWLCDRGWGWPVKGIFTRIEN